MKMSWVAWLDTATIAIVRIIWMGAVVELDDWLIIYGNWESLFPPTSSRNTNLYPFDALYLLIYYLIYSKLRIITFIFWFDKSGYVEIHIN